MTRPRYPLQFGSITFAMAIAAGGAQYVGTIALEQLLSKGLFSQISIILGYFATYMLLVELGIQEELVRRLRNGDGAAERICRKLRLFGAGFAFVALLINSLIVHVSTEVLYGTVAFGLCFFPAAMLMTSEARGYMQRSIWQATGLRASRGVSILLAASILAWWRPAQMTPVHFAAIFAIFPLCFALMTRVVNRLDQQLDPPRQDRPAQLTVDASPALRQTESLRSFVGDTWHLLISRLLNWVLMGVFYHFCIAYAGDQNLAEFTMAMILTVPISILMQVYSQMYFAHDHEQPAERKNLTFIAALGVAIYGGVLSIPAVQQFSFSKIVYRDLMLFFWPMLMAVLFGGATIIIVINGTGPARRIAALASPCVGLLCIIGTLLAIPKTIPFDYIAFGWLAAAILGTITARLCFRLQPGI